MPDERELCAGRDGEDVQDVLVRLAHVALDGRRHVQRQADDTRPPGQQEGGGVELQRVLVVAHHGPDDAQRDVRRRLGADAHDELLERLELQHLVEASVRHEHEDLQQLRQDEVDGRQVDLGHVQQPLQHLGVLERLALVTEVEQIAQQRHSVVARGLDLDLEVGELRVDALVLHAGVGEQQLAELLAVDLVAVQQLPGQQRLLGLVAEGADLGRVLVGHRLALLLELVQVGAQRGVEQLEVVEEVLGQEAVAAHPHARLLLEVHQRHVFAAVLLAESAAAAGAEDLGVAAVQRLPADAADLRVLPAWRVGVRGCRLARRTAELGLQPHPHGRQP